MEWGTNFVDLFEEYFENNKNPMSISVHIFKINAEYDTVYSLYCTYMELHSWDINRFDTFQNILRKSIVFNVENGLAFFISCFVKIPKIWIIESFTRNWWITFGTGKPRFVSGFKFNSLAQITWFEQKENNRNAIQFCLKFNDGDDDDATYSSVETENP